MDSTLDAGDERPSVRSTRPGVERALSRALIWTVGGASLSLPLLLIAQPLASGQLLATALIHLSVLVIFGLVVASDLARPREEIWFSWLGPFGRTLASGAAMVALTVGVVALVTLPSSAALRLQPSLQFLQLLSALDIAWAAGATLIGFGWWLGRRAGILAGSLVGVVCVWSIWRYLEVVGFTTDGGWLVDGAALFQYVLPYDMAATVVATTGLIFAARRATQTRDAPDTG